MDDSKNEGKERGMAENNKKIKPKKQYCCICDTEIETWKIDKRPERVCKKCSRIHHGYYEEEKDFVKGLREYITTDSHWQIEMILIIFRGFLKKKGIILKEK